MVFLLFIVIIQILLYRSRVAGNTVHRCRRVHAVRVHPATRRAVLYEHDKTEQNGESEKHHLQSKDAFELLRCLWSDAHSSGNYTRIHLFPEVWRWIHFSVSFASSAFAALPAYCIACTGLPFPVYRFWSKSSWGLSSFLSSGAEERVWSPCGYWWGSREY